MYSCVLSCAFFCVLCFCVVLCPCPVVCPVPCLPCLWCVCVVLWLWCVGASCPCSPYPCGCVLRCAPVPLCFSCLFSGHNTCPHIWVCYMWALYTPYMRALFFRFGIYDPFCTHSKSRPLDSECGFPKVGLNFRCSFFLLRNFSQ